MHKNSPISRFVFSIVAIYGCDVKFPFKRLFRFSKISLKSFSHNKIDPTNRFLTLLSFMCT